MRELTLLFVKFLVSLLLAAYHESPPSDAPKATASRATTVEGSEVAFPSPGGEASAYLAMPKGVPGRHPAIMVIHEGWGLNEWVRQDADRFAAQGYVALAVDLYRERPTGDAGEAHEFARGLPDDPSIAGLRAGLDWLRARRDVDASKLGVIGWCTGGGYALGLASAEPGVRAVVVNDGHLMTDAAALASVKASLLGNFGGKDRAIGEGDVHAFESAFRASNRDVDVKIYPGQGHGFMNPNERESYDRAAADDAWSRIDAFFARTLEGPRGSG